MERRIFRQGDDPALYPEAVLCRDLSIPTKGRPVTIRRGVALIDALKRLPETADDVELHIVVPVPGEIPQAEASIRLARAVAGAGIVVRPPHQGQVDLRAEHNGVLRVDQHAVRRLNCTPVTLIATALDGRVVEPGETVAIVKASELLISSSSIAQALGEIGSTPVVRVARFQRRRVAILAGERIGTPNLRVSSKHLGDNLARFGAELTIVRQVRDQPDEITAAYRDLLAEGIELILVVGSIVLDPEDPFFVALQPLAASLVRRGAPVDPGTMFWNAYIGAVPVFGLASCEMYGRLSIVDLLLPYALAGEPITVELFAELGYGGLLSETQPARRPPGWDS